MNGTLVRSLAHATCSDVPRECCSWVQLRPYRPEGKCLLSPCLLEAKSDFHHEDAKDPKDRWKVT